MLKRNPNLFIRRTVRRLKQTWLWKVLRGIYFAPGCLYSLRYLFYPKVNERKTVFIMIGRLFGGGAERVATVIASELTKKYHVVLLCVRQSKDNFPVSPFVDIMYVPGSLWSRGRFSGIFAGYVKLLKRRQGAYASISLLYNMNDLNVNTKVGDKVICSERNNPTKNSDSVRIREIEDIYQRADHVVFQSTMVRDLFNDKVKEHCTILPTPVRVTCLRETNTKHRIVNCGRLQYQKNQFLLIRAFSRFRKHHPEYTLSIYGVGPLRNELMSLINSLNIQDSVTLEGRSAQVNKDIADAEIFVLSSDFEGLSNALLEAMMMGFPCISTDCEGSTDVIEDGVDGLLIHRGNEDELVSSMLILAENEEYRERLGVQAKITAERFKSEIVSQEWAELIKRV